MNTRLPGAVLIVGCRRSGTTLLRTILEGHPELLVHPAEPQFILELYQHYGFGRINADAAVEHIVKHPYRAPAVTRKALAGDVAPSDLRHLVYRYIATWSDGHNQKCVVLKDPALVFFLDVADMLFSDCDVIHIVRDPRANVSSQRRRWPQFSVLTCAMHWRRAVREARAWGRHHPDRYMEVQYEALVQDPETSIRELCQFLSLPYLQDLAVFRQPARVYESGVATKTILFTEPDASRIHAWRNRLNCDDIQLIEMLCSDEMKQWKYESVAPTKFSARLRLRLAKEYVGYWAYRLAGLMKKLYRRLPPQKAL